MAEISRENFYARLDTAPHAVRGFFETIVQHFERKNDVLVRHTNSDGGNLRLALLPYTIKQKLQCNFAKQAVYKTAQSTYAQFLKAEI